MPDSSHSHRPTPSSPRTPRSSATRAEVERVRAALLETIGCWPAGRVPKTLTPDELAAAGHVRVSPLRALRARCLDCCAGSAHQVRLCTAAGCPSWPFRMGQNPWRAKPSQEQRERGRALAAERRARAADQGEEGRSDTEAADA